MNRNVMGRNVNTGFSVGSDPMMRMYVQHEEMGVKFQLNRRVIHGQRRWAMRLQENLVAVGVYDMSKTVISANSR